MKPAAQPMLREWLREGPYTLALSAGFFGFFAHAGALSVLEQEGLVPSKVSGASAGALVAGVWASGVDAQAIARELVGIRRRDFWDPGFGLGLLRGALFRSRLDALLSAKTFESCRATLSISVFDVGARRTRVLRTGDVAAAIQASCALPVLFQPVAIAGRSYIDGGVADRPGMAGAHGDARVLLHYLPSRSPWRAFYRGAQTPSSAPGTAMVVADALPRVGPFTLEIGARVLELARHAMHAALGRNLGEC